ncbi:hypothetical protein MLD38_020456 [Melastoma candidum]|uniref:Uncharacterized protein n=1 Tax=Melastoma candidum TaxID=119954 RepID=A0ACB9QDC1_9MYRT|nr:hypothetical protein MLD38_020456 [Melastoma candidum]
MVPPINTPVPPPPHQPQVAVVSPLYCSPNAADLAIVSKSSFNSKTTFVVTDPSDNILFKVKGPGWTWHYHVSLLDAAGNPILNLKPKRSCLSSRWNAYRGESSDEKDLLFTVKLKSVFKSSKLDVFLVNNVGKDRPDFRVEMNWWRTSCVIYAGDSNSVVAQMREKHGFFKFKYMVTVHPNVDAAFITAIIVILDEIYSSSSSSSSS